MPSQQEQIAARFQDPVSVIEDYAFAASSVARQSPATMSNAEFFSLSRLIQDFCGIKLPLVKKMMLEGRLRRRLQALDMKSFAEYFEYLFDSKRTSDEFIHMFDAVTTNKTDFFRESDHFDYLLAKALPELVISQRLGIGKPLNAWSAGCSTGEEPYTLAMVVSEFADKVPGFQFSILGTDISTKVLAKAVAGTYEHESVEPIPMHFRKKYLLRSRSKNEGLVRIAPEIRASVRFARLNLMQEDFGLALLR
jgi:chemotaxis protein methyltransferase CheR